MLRSTLLVQFFILLMGSLGIAEHANTSSSRPLNPKPKFDRVLVVSGGGFNAAVFLGMVAGLMEKGWKPDVVVSTCGSSVANGILNALPNDPKRWLEYLKSDEYFELLHSAKLNKSASTGDYLLGSMAEMKIDEVLSSGLTDDQIPDLFHNNLMFVPLKMDIDAPTLARPFSSDGTRSVMVGTRLKFNPSYVGEDRRGEKLYQEVFFTDPDTAERLRGTTSPIAICFPDSAVEKSTRAVTDCLVTTGARASISDPYYMNPMEIDGEYFLAGSVDLYPVEIGKKLSKGELLMTACAGFDAIEQMAIATTFHYDNNERVRKVHDINGLRWIDLTDTPDFYSKSGFNPQIKFDTEEIELRNLFTRPKQELLRGAHLSHGVPQSRTQFLQKIESQWEYGRARALEALETKLNSTDHLRSLDDRNASPELLKRHGDREQPQD